MCVCGGEGWAVRHLLWAPLTRDTVPQHLASLESGLLQSLAQHWSRPHQLSFCFGNFLPAGIGPWCFHTFATRTLVWWSFHCPLRSYAIHVNRQDSETHLVDRWEGRLPSETPQVSRLPFFPDQLGRQSRRRVYSSWRNSNPVVSNPFSNQRDRLTSNVLVNMTGYLALWTRQHLWKVAGNGTPAVPFSS